MPVSSRCHRQGEAFSRKSRWTLQSFQAGQPQAMGCRSRPLLSDLHRPLCDDATTTWIIYACSRAESACLCVCVCVGESEKVSVERERQAARVVDALWPFFVVHTKKGVCGRTREDGRRPSVCGKCGVCVCVCLSVLRSYSVLGVGYGWYERWSSVSPFRIGGAGAALHGICGSGLCGAAAHAITHCLLDKDDKYQNKRRERALNFGCSWFSGCPALHGGCAPRGERAALNPRSSGTHTQRAAAAAAAAGGESHSNQNYN